MDNLGKSSDKIVFTLLISQSLFSAASILLFTVSSIIVVGLAQGDSRWTGVPSTFALAGAALIAYPVGRLMDRAGRRAGLSLGHALGVTGVSLAGWAVTQGSLPLFLAGIFLFGMARGTVEQGRYAAAEASPPQRRGRAISLVVLGGTVGSVTGPSLVALSDRLAGKVNVLGVSGPWLTAAALFTLGLTVISVFLRPDPKVIALRLASSETGQPPLQEKARAFRELLPDPRTRLAIGAMVASQLAMVVVMTVTPVHMHSQQHDFDAISLVIMAHTMGMFGLSFLTGWLVDRLGRSRIILAGGLILIAACLVVPLSARVAWLAVALFLLGLGWNFAFVAGSALLDDVLLPGEKGRVQGTVDAMVKTASGVGSLSSGLIFAADGFALTSWLTVLVAVVPVALALLLSAADLRLPLGTTTPG